MKINLIPMFVLSGALAAPALAFAFPSSSSANAQEPKEVPKDTPKEDEKPKVLEVGSTVPETLTLPDFDGKNTSFKDLRGKVVIVHFWSDRCPAEKHANPVFTRMEEKYKDNKDVVILGIASNQNELGEKPAKDADYSKLYTNFREKLKEAKLTHKILADHGNVVSDLFAARSTPHCYVIDKKGVLQYAGALDDDQREKKGDAATNYVVNATTAVLEGKRPEVTTTKPYG